MIFPYRQHAPALRARGFNPIPIRPGTKRPALTGWQEWCTEPIPADLVAHLASSPVPYGIGLALGYRGLVAFDCDSDDPEVQAIIHEVLA